MARSLTVKVHFDKRNSLHQAMAGNANLTALVTQFIQPTLSSNERARVDTVSPVKLFLHN